MLFTAHGPSPPPYRRPAGSAEALLAQCRASAYACGRKAGGCGSAPKDRFDDRLRAELAGHKPELIALLSAPPAEPAGPPPDPSERWGPSLDHSEPPIDVPADHWRWRVANLPHAEWVAWRAGPASCKPSPAGIGGLALDADEIIECDQLAAAEVGVPGARPGGPVPPPDPAQRRHPCCGSLPSTSTKTWDFSTPDRPGGRDGGGSPDPRRRRPPGSRSRPRTRERTALDALAAPVPPRPPQDGGRRHRPRPRPTPARFGPAASPELTPDPVPDPTPPAPDRAACRRPATTSRPSR